MNHDWYTKVGAGAHILFLHGWKDRKETWLPVINFLKDTFTCWAIDLPGFGSHPRPERAWTPMDYAEWLRQFVHEQHLERYYLVGHSFGGRVGMCLAVREPSRLKKLVLYGTPGFRERSPLWKELLIFFYKAAKLDHLQWLQKTPLFQRLQHRLRSRDYQESGDVRDIFLASIQYDLTNVMRNVSQPTLLLHGEYDTVVPLMAAKKMQATLPHAAFKIIPQGSHFAHLENPRLFSGYLREFFYE